MFEMFAETIESIECGVYESYGIRAKSDCETIEISDVSPSRERVAAFVALLNELGASPIHLFDLIQDNLGINL